MSYPRSTQRVDDDQAREVLRLVQLSHLQDRLEEEIDWSRVLSTGEQQRLGFACILVNRPRLIFFDEATSAVDQGIEHTLYTLIRENLPGCTLVSVGHRSSLNALHTQSAIARRGTLERDGAHQAARFQRAGSRRGSRSRSRRKMTTVRPPTSQANLCVRRGWMPGDLRRTACNKLSGRGKRLEQVLIPLPAAPAAAALSITRGGCWLGPRSCPASS